MPKPNTGGAKTHGRWIDESGDTQEVVSGRDERSDAAWNILRQQGIPAPGQTTTVADVEQKLAAQMATEGRTHMEVVINNEPCKGPYGCDSLVPVILPEGSTLTVHGPAGYRKTYTGGAKPWWR